jgi:hypothetical protein
MSNKTIFFWVKIYMGPAKFIWDPHDLVGPIWIIYFFVVRRNGEIYKFRVQTTSGGAGVWTPVIVSNLTISAVFVDWAGTCGQPIWILTNKRGCVEKCVVSVKGCVVSTFGDSIHVEKFVGCSVLLALLVIVYVLYFLESVKFQYVNILSFVLLRYF